MEALENTLYIYDKVKEYITEVKKRIDEFLINNPKFISEVKEFFNKIAKYLRLVINNEKLNFSDFLFIFKQMELFDGNFCRKKTSWRKPKGMLKLSEMLE